MSIDLRGFEYALEPLRRQRQWQLDALLARLGRAQQAVQEAQGALEALRDEHRAQSLEIARSLARRPDPVHHVRGLRWLAQLRTRIVEAEARLRELEAERAEIRLQCMTQQQKVDVIEAHREECVADFVRAEASRMAADADRDWLARASFRRAAARRPAARGVRP